MSDTQKIQTNNGSNSIKPVIGAHLFFGAGPLNWLNSLNKSRIKEDISQIKTEGFTHLFLIIPWAEILFDDQSHARSTLKEVLSEAELQNMGVFLRICYLWESGKTLRSTYQLMNDWPHSEATQGHLREYLRIIRELSSNVHTNIKYFVSWEDLYWPIYRHWEQETLERRAHLANISGFNTFLDLINANDVPREIPPYICEHSILFTSFFDNIIIPRFLNVVKQELGEIGFEYRIDSDHVGYIDQSKITPSFYHWSRSQPFCNKKFIYFHQNIGGSDEKELGTRAAINNLDWLLRTTSPMRNFKEDLPLIDQFNFIDTTESNWAAISEQGDEINTFLKESISLIGKKSSGMALWGYHDWPKDIMFNGSFNYDLSGWICDDLTLLQCNGFCHFSIGGIISQEVKLELPVDRDWTCKVEIENTQDIVAEFSISLGNQIVCHKIPSYFKGCIETLLTPINFLTLSIKCLAGEFNLTNVKLYDRVYSQGGKQSQQVNSVPFDCFLNAVEGQKIKIEKIDSSKKEETVNLKEQSGSNTIIQVQNKIPVTSLHANDMHAKFIIFCTSRSGSTMLSSALSLHPDIIFHGEVFGFSEYPMNFSGIDSESKEHIFLGSLLKNFRDSGSIDFLEKFIWPSNFDNRLSIGFKIKAEEAEETRRELFNRILAEDNLKIVLVRRENFWLRFLSILRTIDSHYFNTSDFSETVNSGLLDSNSIINLLHDALAKERVFDELSEQCKINHSVVEISYEDMVSDWSKSLSKVEDFLSVAQLEIQPFTAKLNSFPTKFQSETVNQIDEELKGTKFYEHFCIWRSTTTF